MYVSYKGKNESELSSRYHGVLAYTTGYSMEVTPDALMSWGLKYHKCLYLNKPLHMV